MALSRGCDDCARSCKLRSAARPPVCAFQGLCCIRASYEPLAVRGEQFLIYVWEHPSRSGRSKFCELPAKASHLFVVGTLQPHSLFVSLFQGRALMSCKKGRMIA